MTTSPYLIDDILPSEEVHLLAGPSGAGKTTVLLHIIPAWQRGESVFGHASHPQPYVYVSCDRSRKSVNSTLARLGLLKEVTRIISRSDLPKKVTLSSILKKAREKYPDAVVFFIEGFQLLQPRGNDYANTGEWLASVTSLCEREHFTIVGVAHSPKRREDSAIIHPRESVLGSVAWAAYSDTVIYLDINEGDRSRYMQIMPRNAPEEEHQFTLGEGGRIVWITDEVDNVLEAELIDLNPGTTITRKRVLAIALTHNLTERTANRILSKLVDSRELIKQGRGLYVRSTNGEVINVDFQVNV